MSFSPAWYDPRNPLLFSTYYRQEPPRQAPPGGATKHYFLNPFCSAWLTVCFAYRIPAFSACFVTKVKPLNNASPSSPLACLCFVDPEVPVVPAPFAGVRLEGGAAAPPLQLLVPPLLVPPPAAPPPAAAALSRIIFAASSESCLAF